MWYGLLARPLLKLEPCPVAAVRPRGATATLGTPSAAVSSSVRLQNSCSPPRQPTIPSMYARTGTAPDRLDGSGRRSGRRRFARRVFPRNTDLLLLRFARRLRLRMSRSTPRFRVARLAFQDMPLRPRVVRRVAARAARVLSAPVPRNRSARCGRQRRLRALARLSRSAASRSRPRPRHRSAHTPHLIPLPTSCPAK